MGNFQDLTKRLDIYKTRELTDDEASKAVPRLSKYRTRLKARPVEKLGINIVLNPFVPSAQDYYGQLLFQYNVTLPWNFYILDSPQESTDIRGCITIKWRVGTTVYRYFLYGNQSYIVQIPHVSDDNYTIHNFPSYSGEKILKNCCFEYWSARFRLGSTEYGTYGLPNGFTILSNRLVSPTSADDISNFVYSFDGIDKADFDVDLPEDIPTVQPVIAWLDNI